MLPGEWAMLRQYLRAPFASPGVLLPVEGRHAHSPALGATETWEFYKFTADAHPIHLHQVQFQVVGRQALKVDDDGMALQPAELAPGTARGPESNETGPKDTVVAYPGEVTRVQATFDLAGLYVWHCHIVEHEDNEMPRPFRVG